jgi:hypothetical protein
MFSYLHDHLTHLFSDQYNLKEQEVSGKITSVKLCEVLRNYP